VGVGVGVAAGVGVGVGVAVGVGTGAGEVRADDAVGLGAAARAVGVGLEGSELVGVGSAALGREVAGSRGGVGCVAMTEAEATGVRSAAWSCPSEGRNPAPVMAMAPAAPAAAAELLSPGLTRPITGARSASRGTWEMIEPIPSTPQRRPTETFRKARTTTGSSWVPEARTSSARAAATDTERR
jgi:hypothetical protein